MCLFVIYSILQMKNFIFFIAILFLPEMLFSQIEKSGLKEFRYDIGYENASFLECAQLISLIEKLNGVIKCECNQERNRITIFTKDEAGKIAVNEDDFKWIFLDFKLNVNEQKRIILSVNSVPIEKPKSKGDLTNNDSNAPKKNKTVKITGKH